MIDARVEQVGRYRPIEALIPTHWQTGFVSANGIRQSYYRTGGDKPPLVLLHGILEGALSWMPVARALESDYDVVMLDARGHGRSSRVSGDFTPETLAADVAAAVDALGLTLVRMIGFSLGSTTAALVAAGHPTTIERVLLVGVAETGGTAMDMAKSPAYQAWLADYVTWLTMLGRLTHEEHMVAALSQLPPGAPVPSEEDYVAWVENNALVDVTLVEMSGTLWSQLEATIARMQSALARIECPVLIVKSSAAAHSSGPLVITGEPSDRPHVKILRFRNTGHLVPRDRFHAFLATAREFLASRS
jgi:N-formylmaleamate deformylase